MSRTIDSFLSQLPNAKGYQVWSVVNYTTQTAAPKTWVVHPKLAARGGEFSEYEPTLPDSEIAERFKKKLEDSYRSERFEIREVYE